MTNDWTALHDIARVAITFLGGDPITVDVDAIIRNTADQPLWLVHTDTADREVMVPWTSIRTITILERRPPRSPPSFVMPIADGPRRPGFRIPKTGRR